MLRQALKSLAESYVSRFQKRLIKQDFNESMGAIYYGHRFGDIGLVVSSCIRGYNLLCEARDLNLRRKKMLVDTKKMEGALCFADLMLDANRFR